ncbi:MAG: hypothetical protein ACFCU5_13170 [Pleurocapsa sp.]
MATVLSSQDQEKSANPISTDYTPQSSLKQMVKCYQADGQVKFLHLHAEVDILWQKLQALKHQKEIVDKKSVSVQ